MLELEERPPKKTTAAGTAGDAQCAGDGTGRDGEADGRRTRDRRRGIVGARARTRRGRVWGDGAVRREDCVAM